MIHGGDVYTNGLLKGKSLIDYSSNINPLGVPSSFINNLNEAVDALTRYPDIQYREVLRSLKEYTGVREEYFVLGNGAAEVIDLVISCFKSILIVVPSFVEYELNAKKWGCSIEYSYLIEKNNTENYLNNSCEELVYDCEDILNKLNKVDAIILGNPNNPNGNIINKKEFLKVLNYCEENNKVIIIDEAFIEFVGDLENSFVHELENYKCLFIIRALTKFFALPGIRFGYGTSSNKELLSKIKAKQNPWNINCFAEVAVKYSLKDKEYINKSIKWITDERIRFLNAIKKIDFIEKCFLTYGNYVLCKLKGITADELYNLCLEHGYVIRKADNYQSLNEYYVRFAIKDEEKNKNFVNMLAKLEVGTDPEMV